MRSKQIMAIIGIIFSTIGLICISICNFPAKRKESIAGIWLNV